jgi:hypothetical protein
MIDLLALRRTTQTVQAAAAVLLTALAAHGVFAQTPLPARYAIAIENELANMGLVAHCESISATRHRCSYPSRLSALKGSSTFQLEYSDETDTVYFYVARFLVLLPEDSRTDAVLRHLMELNAELLVGKFEWNARTGEIRLGAVLNTDSNFDRRAFRSIVRTLDALAAQYIGPLRALK